MTENAPSSLRPVTVVVHVMLAAMFFLFAWLQQNDLDPAIYDKPSALDAALWLAFYAVIGAMFVASLFRRVPVWLLLLAAVACIAEMAATGPGLYENVFGGKDFTMTQASMSAEDPRVELTREFFGAVIALLGVGILLRRERRRAK
jgi:glucan phosphoethanolaminetransferase (alkaline phosphatase superfamily)